MTETEKTMRLFEEWIESGGVDGFDLEVDEDEFSCPYYIDSDTARAFFAFAGGLARIPDLPPKTMADEIIKTHGEHHAHNLLVAINSAL